MEDNSGRPSGVCSSYRHGLISVVSVFPQEPFPPSAHPTLYAAWGINSTTGSSGGAIHFIMVREYQSRWRWKRRMLLWIMLRGVCENHIRVHMILELGPWMGRHWPPTPGAYSHWFKVGEGNQILEFALRFEYFFIRCIEVPWTTLVS